MVFFDQLNMGIFNTVQYSQELQDDGWFSKIEAAADVCRGPSRWLADECRGVFLRLSGKAYTVTYVDNVVTKTNEIYWEEEEPRLTEGSQKIMRIVLGLFLSLLGQVLALPLMGIAYFSEEIRLKHKMTVKELTDEERQKLKDLIDKRQELAKERQGCEPISCFLFSIWSLLCYLVCCKK